MFLFPTTFDEISNEEDDGEKNGDGEDNEEYDDNYFHVDKVVVTVVGTLANRLSNAPSRYPP